VFSSPQPRPVGTSGPRETTRSAARPPDWALFPMLRPPARGAAGLEDLLHEPGARIGRGARTQASSSDLLDDVEWHGPAGQVAREALGALDVLGRYRLLAMHRESRVDPAQQRVKELLRQPLGAVQALEEATAEYFLDEPRGRASRASAARAGTGGATDSAENVALATDVARRRSFLKTLDAGSIPAACVSGLHVGWHPGK